MFHRSLDSTDDKCSMMMVMCFERERERLLMTHARGVRDGNVCQEGVSLFN